MEVLERWNQPSPGLTSKFVLALTALLFSLSPSLASAQDEVVYYHTDAIGSVRMITDASGAEIERYDFLPFGEPWAVPTTQDVRQYAGKERDVESGLDYFGARYYRGVSGRFISVDPALDLNKAAVDPQQWNRYAYSHNNPLKFVDPDGREIWLTASHQNALSEAGRRSSPYVLPAVAAATTASLGGPVAWRLLVSCVLSPSCQSTVLSLGEEAAGGVSGNVSRLSSAEFATGQRLAQKLGQTIEVSEHKGAEFILNGKSYDAMGAPGAYSHWNPKQFFESIDSHLLKSNDFTVIDFTGASKSQIGAIRGYVGGLSKELQAKIIYVGELF